MEDFFVEIYESKHVEEEDILFGNYVFNLHALLASPMQELTGRLNTGQN